MPRRSSSSQKRVAFTHNHERTFSERIADWCTQFFGTPRFFLLHVLLFSGWILYNVGFIPGIPVIDPYPFNFLTTTVSLEAIFLSIVVLMSQNREERIANVRAELDLQVNIQSEKEVTKILEMLSMIEKRLHVVQKVDPELLDMLKKIDLNQLEARVIRAIETSGK
jgi:uncharacterized membrane protein